MSAESEQVQMVDGSAAWQFEETKKKDVLNILIFTF